jgi:HNH endonuclease
MPYLSKAVRDRISQQARNRCGYCQSQQELVPVIFEVEHIRPLARGGGDDEDNLWLSCRTCNLYKSDQIEADDPLTEKGVPLFNPRYQNWAEHFQWSEDGIHIIGKTVVGRATVVALQLNNPIMLTTRRMWVQAGWHPPKD